MPSDEALGFPCRSAPTSRKAHAGLGMDRRAPGCCLDARHVPSPSLSRGTHLLNPPRVVELNEDSALRSPTHSWPQWRVPSVARGLWLWHHHMAACTCGSWAPCVCLPPRPSFSGSMPSSPELASGLLLGTDYFPKRLNNKQF